VTKTIKFGHKRIMKKKNPNDLTEEELLEGIDEEAEELEVFHEDDFLSFLSYYSIQSGEHRVASSIMWTLYKHWSKDPIREKSFYYKLAAHFESVFIRGYPHYLINFDPQRLSAYAIAHIKKNKKQHLKHPNKINHFEAFLAFNGLKAGKKEWIKDEDFYFMYDKWTYKNKSKLTLSRRQFDDFCRIYFKWKRLEERGKWYGVEKEEKAE